MTTLIKIEEVSISKSELFDFQKEVLEWLKNKNYVITAPAPNDIIDMNKREKEID